MGLALEMKFTGTAELEVVMVPLLLRVNHSTIRPPSGKQQFCLHTEQPKPQNKLFSTSQELRVHSDLVVCIQSLKSGEISEKLVVFCKLGWNPPCHDIIE